MVLLYLEKVFFYKERKTEEELYEMQYHIRDYFWLPFQLVSAFFTFIIYSVRFAVASKWGSSFLYLFLDNFCKCEYLYLVKIIFMSIFVSFAYKKAVKKGSHLRFVLLLTRLIFHGRNKMLNMFEVNVKHEVNVKRG